MEDFCIEEVFVKEESNEKSLDDEITNENLCNFEVKMESPEDVCCQADSCDSLNSDSKNR